MKLIITSNATAWVVHYIHRFLHTHPGTVNLCFPTGGTVLDVYAQLARLFGQGQLATEQIALFQMDEYVALPPTDPQSYRFYLQQYLVQPLHITRTHFLDANAADLSAVCTRYETTICESGGLDLVLGGVGENGHIAFNEPGTPFSARTHVVNLTDSTRRANARFFDADSTRVPTQALTIGPATILEARNLLFVATGPKKAAALAKLAKPGSTPLCPLSALKLHPNAILVADPQAARLVPPTTSQLEISYE